MNSSGLMGGYSAYTTPAAAQNDLVNIPDGTVASDPFLTIIGSLIVSAIIETFK
ncbi:hypothetical protein [Kitasatospora phosalacinea]|uniref:Uncharacterized protein n=1 Tax=Kitasatospora phosalacinea TaxID=2065 RepID=A0ABW6GPC4_9ACTN